MAEQEVASRNHFSGCEAAADFCERTGLPTRAAMAVEWQGDHKMLRDSVKQEFERELKRLRLDKSDFIVEVRREPAQSQVSGTDAKRYEVFVTELGRPDKDTLKLEGGQGENWIGQLEAKLKHRG